MILDSFNMFSAVAGDQPTTTANAGFDIDLGITGGLPPSASGAGARDIGVGDDPSLKIMVDVTATFAGGTSLQCSLQGAPDNGSGGEGSFTTMVTGPVVALAQLIQGARIFEVDVPRPAPGQAMPRFLRLVYTIVGTMSGGGTLRSYIVGDRIDQPGSQTGILSGYVPGVTVPN